MLAVAGKHVGGDRDRLQRDEEGDEVAARRHDAHAEHRREQQEIELALVVVAFGDVVDREQDRHVGDDQEEALQRERVVVDHVRATEHRPVVAVDGEGEYGDQRTEHADRRDPRRLPRAAIGQQEVGDEDDEDGRDENDVGRERVPIDRGVHGVTS